MGAIEQIRKLILAYPDTSHRRKILTQLGDLDEQLNAFLFGLLNTQGYKIDSDGGADAEKRIRPDD